MMRASTQTTYPNGTTVLFLEHDETEAFVMLAADGVIYAPDDDNHEGYALSPDEARLLADALDRLPHPDGWAAASFTAIDAAANGRVFDELAHPVNRYTMVGRVTRDGGRSVTIDTSGFVFSPHGYLLTGDDAVQFARTLRTFADQREAGIR